MNILLPHLDIQDLRPITRARTIVTREEDIWQELHFNLNLTLPFAFRTLARFAIKTKMTFRIISYIRFGCLSKLTSDLDDSIQLESHVESITADSGQIVSVRVNGHEQPVSAVISTVPIHILADLVKGTDALAPLSKFRYRAMACVNLQFSGEGLLPNAVLWTPEEQFPFLRLTELTQGVPWMAPPGKTQISADIGCEIGGDIWSMPDDRLGELCIESIDPIISNARNKYLGCKVARAPFAYPLFLREYEADRVALEQSTGVDGLHVIGRNGEFAHILMEDIYWRTLTKVRQVVAARNNTERYI